MTKTTTSTRKNAPRLLNEEVKESSVVLIEDVLMPEKPLQLEMVEGANNSKKWVLKGTFGHVDKATENKRVYPKAVIEREIKRLGESMGKRRVFSELDHPADGRTSLNRVACLLTKLEVKPDNTVYGEAEILNTQCGSNLKALAEAGAGIGFSSRGFGTTKQTESGDQMVQDDYRLVTYDAVADPASKKAWPEAVQESFGQSNTEALVEGGLTLDALKLVEETRELQEKLAKRESEDASTELRLEAAAAEIVGAILQSKKSPQEGGSSKNAQEVQSAVSAALRSILPEHSEGKNTMENDPKIAELQKTVDSFQKKLDDANEATAKFQEMARIAAYAYHLETLVFGHDEHAHIRALIGPLSAIESKADLDARVESIKRDLKEKQLEHVQVETRMSEENKALKEENEKLKVALKDAMKIAKDSSVSAYVAERVRFHPKSAQILEAFKTTPPSTRDEVDTMINKFRVSIEESSHMDDIRARVRAQVGSQGSPGASEPVVDPKKLEGGAAKPEPVTESVRRTPGNGNGFNGVGVDLASLQRLSGLSRN